MRVIAPSKDLQMPLHGGAILNIKKGEYYVFTESFVLELSQTFGENIVGSEMSMDGLFVPYRGQDLHEKSLFCFRTSGIGDFLGVMTALRTLKDKYPTCKISIGSFGTNQYLAESDPCIDEFVPVPYPIKYLTESNFVLQYQGIIENATQESKEVNFYDIFLKYSFIEDYQNIPTEQKIPKVYIDEQTDRKIESLFKKHEIVKPSVGIQIRTSSTIRNYPISLIKQLVSMLSNALKLNVVLIGTPKESEQIIKKNLLDNSELVFDFAQYSKGVKEFISIVNHCDFIISPDTASLHIAGALGKPMVGLFGPIKSDLRISNFKNAIGMDANTICSPCFKHGNTPCRNALENGDSPCMYILRPEKIVETVRDEILPLFGFDIPKKVEQVVSEDPEPDEDAKKAIVTLAIGDGFKEMLEIAKPFFEKYAQKVNADFIVIDQEKINVMFPNMEKFQIKELLEKYDRIAYFDADILIHPDCPDLFKIVPKDKVGFVPDSPDAKWNNLSRYREIVISQDKLGQIGWGSGYFNSGVMIFSKQHAGLFDNPELRSEMGCQYRDQTLLNYNFQKNKYEPFILDKKFNGMEIVGFTSRTENQNKTNAMVMHFAHEGNVVEQMKKISSLFDLKKENNLPIMFYDSGELGWSMYLAAHINYLVENKIYEDVTVCASKARHVLYKDIKNIKLLDIPDEIKEKTKNLDQDGTHLYDHETKQRVKNDVLFKMFQDHFKDYKVYPKFGFFNGERSFFKYKASDEAKNEIQKFLDKKIMLVFPRNRIGKFGQRNLSKEFYINLVRKLAAEWPDHYIISIGSKNGAYLLRDGMGKENFIDLVDYDDDKTIDILIALCNSGNVEFAVGSQSSLPKISLLLGVPTYMIGHEKDRHVRTENWSNTLVGFTEVRPDGYFELGIGDDCIREEIFPFIINNKIINDFVFDEKIICPTDPTATNERISQYKEYYKTKYEICKKQNPKKIVEIGVRAGYSAWTFLQACPEALYIGYDANNGQHGGAGGEDGSFSKWAHKILDGYKHKLIELDTQKTDSLKLMHDVDFFHVDGDHTTEGVMHDLDLAYSVISENGLILVDDITYLQQVKDGVDLWLSKMKGKVKSEFMTSLRGEMLIRKA